MYEERFYRAQISSRFRLEISFRESDLLISTDRKIDKERAEEILKKYYRQIEEYVKENPRFLTSLSPLPEDEKAPPIIRSMLESSQVTGIGPFSAVAGAIAQYTGQEILGFCSEIIVENGGDIFLKINTDKTLGVYPGKRFGVENITLRIKKRDQAFGIASSSGVIGPSLNFGAADLVSVIAEDAVSADGFATALSNRIKQRGDVDKVLAEVKESSLLEGLLIVFGREIFLWGDWEVA